MHCRVRIYNKYENDSEVLDHAIIYIILQLVEHWRLILIIYRLYSSPSPKTYSPSLQQINNCLT